MLRRVVLAFGRAKFGECEVFSHEFARRWLTQQLFAPSVAGLEHTIYGRLQAQLHGAKVGIVDDFSAMPPEPDLYSAGSNLFIANNVLIRSFIVNHGGIAHFGKISLDKGCMVFD